MLVRAGLALVAASTLSCGQAILSAPTGSLLFMTVNPPFITANGDTAIVSVLVVEPAGTPVPDGTVVQFFTTLGRIQEQGKTNDGVARVNLISDARSGTARVSAFSGQEQAESVEVTIGATRPTQVFASLVDSRIDLSEGRSTATVKATVLDSNGNRVAGIPVRFSITDNPATDRVVDQPEQSTNNGGEASVRVQTSRTVPGTIRVRITVLAASSLTADVDIPVIE